LPRSQGKEADREGDGNGQTNLTYSVGIVAFRKVPWGRTGASRLSATGSKAHRESYLPREQPVQWEIGSFRHRRKGIVSDPPSRIASFYEPGPFGRGLDA
jgi:hypothetical protein